MIRAADDTVGSSAELLHQYIEEQTIKRYVFRTVGTVGVITGDTRSRMTDQYRDNCVETWRADEWMEKINSKRRRIYTQAESRRTRRDWLNSLQIFLFRRSLRRKKERVM